MKSSGTKECIFPWASKANRNKCNCFKRCDGWFGSVDGVQGICYNRCRQSPDDFTKEQLLSDAYAQQLFMKVMGYDPLPDDAITMGGLIDPAGNNQRNSELLKTMLPFIALFIILIISGVFFLAAKNN